MKSDLQSAFQSVRKRVERIFKKNGKKDQAHVYENHGNHLITENSPMRVLEAYSMARANLFYSGGLEGSNVFGVTSASPSDGKSLTCANLAVSFAMSGKRVLLIDCDMRKPTQKNAFGVEAESGLSEYLSGVADEPLVVKTHYENLSLLTSGRCPPNPAELLYRPRFATLMEKMRAEYDFVFIDLPPVGIISDATIVSPHVGSYIVVVRMMQSDYRAVQEATESLEAVGGKIVGIMINDVEERGAAYYYNSKYSKYGKYYNRYYGRYGRYASGTTEDNKTSEEPTKPSSSDEKAEPKPQTKAANTKTTAKTKKQQK